MPVRYGVIGCGAIAQRRHIPECVANPDSKLVALADPVKERVEELAAEVRRQGVHRLQGDAQEPRRRRGRRGRAQQPARRPEHRRAQRRQARPVREADGHHPRRRARRCSAAAEKNKKYLMIGLNQRLMPPHVRAKEILKSGRLGKVLAFRTAFQHPGPEGWSVDAGKSWFFKKGQAFMGVTGDLGVHKADLLRWLLGQEFAEVGGILATLDKRDPEGNLIDLDDNAYLTLKTTGGIVGSMILSWTNYGAEENYTVLYCQNGVLSLGTDPTWGVIVDYRNGERELHKVGEISTNTKQVASGIIDSFTKSIKENKPPEIDGDEGYKSLDVILTAMEAAKAGKVSKVGA